MPKIFTRNHPAVARGSLVGTELRASNRLPAALAATAMAVLLAAGAGAPRAQAQTFSVIHAFLGGGDGAKPEAGLIMDASGNHRARSSEGGICVRSARVMKEYLNAGEATAAALVDGWGCAGAFTPLCACDLAVAADGATLGLSEVNWGIPPGSLVSRGFAELYRQGAAGQLGETDRLMRRIEDEAVTRHGDGHRYPASASRPL